MASVSPPKPWERGGAAGASTGLLTLIPSFYVPIHQPNETDKEVAMSSTTGMSTTSSALPTTQPSTSALTSPSISGAPPIPERPSSLTTAVNRNASAYSPYGANRLGATPYGGMGSAYTSPYSRLGGMGGYGSSMYGGMGGYGGYGSSMYGGMGGMYSGMPGMGPIDPNDPNSLTNSFSQSTQATFQIIDSIVSAFGGFAQMLESTYMATHSSFFGKIRWTILR
jgi:peroxin-13